MSLTSFLMVAITSVIILFVHLYLIFMECSKVFVPQLYIEAKAYNEDSRTTARVLLLISIIGYSILLFGSGLSIKGLRIESLLVILISFIVIVVVRLLMRKYNSERFNSVLPCINLLSFMALADVIILGLFR
jgi:hypothetical protein